MKKTGIIGAGSWGTALAVTSFTAGCEVLVWSRGAEAADSINNSNENSKYLPGIKLPKDIRATTKMADMAACDALLLVVPAQNLHDICNEMKSAAIGKNIPLVICCKGIEQGSLRLMSEVVADILPNPIAILSGPNFAAEIAMGLPACATIACEDEKLGMQLTEMLGSPFFRTYFSPDIIGAQVGGAVKNVLAIACGIAIGKGLGENARAALVTRGMTEIIRLCLAKGGKMETLMGLSGIGDIMLTCGSRASRNMSLGLALGQGGTMASSKGKVTEGVATAQSVTELAAKLGVEMPIAKAVNDILYNGANIDSTVKNLLQRPLRVEM